MSMIVGIDLGTSNSCVAVFREGEAEVLPNARGERLTPSCVTFDNERILTGEKALKFEDVSNKIHDFKRIIGLEYDRAKEVADYNEWSFILRNIVDSAQIQVKYEGINQYFNAGEISAIVLDELKTLVMKNLGCEEISAVITVPTHFTPKRRAATLDAAKVAGIQVLRLINESTAAAIAVGVLGKRSRKRARRVLIFDLGGGTLDITIVEIKNRSFDVKGYAGDLALGGIDFTRNLAKEMIEAIKLENNLDELDKNFRQEIINEAEKAKIRLSVDDVTRVNLEHGNYHYRANFTRTEMTKLNKELYDRVKDCVEKALKNGATDSDKIHDVVLVGGSVRIPYIRKMMKDRFGKPKIRFSELYCDELIAKGAALLASHLSGVRDTGIGRLHFNDITPLSLGTDVIEDGTSIIIPRNSKLPATFTRSYLPVNDATEIVIKIYQGDNEASPENELIGYFDIPITRTQNVEVKIDVTFDLDCSNLLCATALQRGTGNTRDIQITVAENQNEATIQEQRDRLERIKRNEVALENAIGSMEKECDNLRNLTQFLQRKYKRPHVQDRCKQSLKWMSDNVKNVTENAVAEPEKITKKLREMIKELESLELKERQGEQNGRDNQELGTEPEVPEDDREALERAFCSA